MNPNELIVVVCDAVREAVAADPKSPLKPENVFGEQERELDLKGVASLNLILGDTLEFHDITGEKSFVETSLRSVVKTRTKDDAFLIRRRLRRLLERVLDRAQERGKIVGWTPGTVEAFPETDGINIKREYVIVYKFRITTIE